jgi:DNA-binding PucR family transcriptional regulator
LVESLYRLYLLPLAQERDGGQVLRETLRAYLASGNLSSAAVTLAVSRRTVGNRLRKIEAIVGRPFHTLRPDIETALRLEELKAM